MSIYQHFRPEERTFVDLILDLRDQVDRQFITKYTDFLDPRESYIFESIIGEDERFKVHVLLEDKKTERTMYALSPYYEQLNDTDFPVQLLEATYPTKFVELKHPDLLGSFMSLGIDRKKLGDLVINADSGTIQLLVHRDISSFVVEHLTQIKQANVRFEKTLIQTFEPGVSTWITHQTTVSSLRLDVLVKEIYRMSRSDAKMLIEREHVKVNFKIIDSPAFNVEPSDLISVRKKGRARLQSIEGQTKKEKWRILYKRLVQ